MKRSSKRSPELIRLRSCWNRWTTIIELFARRRPARHRVDPRIYVALHREVLERCRNLAPTADEALRSQVGTMEELATPWLTPRCLDRADREILLDLMERCRSIRRDLGGRRRRWSERVGRWIVPTMLILGLIGAGALLILAADGMLASVADRLDHWAAVARVTARRSSLTERLAALAAVVVIGSIYVASRTARS